MNRSKTNPHTPESILSSESLALAFAQRFAGAKIDVEFSIFHCDCGVRLLLIDVPKVSQSKAFILRQARSFAKENNIALCLRPTTCPACAASLAERVEHFMEFGASGLEKNEIRHHRSPVIEAH